MPKRIHLDPLHVRAVSASLPKYKDLTGKRMIPCHFCRRCTIAKFDDLKGHFEAVCHRCRQSGIYDAADYRRAGAFSRPRLSPRTYRSA